MSILDEVRCFIMRLSPQPVCDDCIAGRLGLPAGQRADQATLELAGTAGFERGRGECSLCGTEKLIIRRS